MTTHFFYGRCPLGRGRHNVKSMCIYVYMCICARHFHTNVWTTQGNFYPKVSLTHLPHLGFLASLNCADLRFLILSEQCHTQISLDCTGNISVVPGRNLLKFLILHNTVNVNHWLTLKYDLCTVHAHLNISCTGNFSAAPDRNLLKFETLLSADKVDPNLISKILTFALISILRGQVRMTWSHRQITHMVK